MMLKENIKFLQFTRYDKENFPECNNEEYLYYKKIEGYDDIINYAYQEQIINEDGTKKIKWLKKEEVKDAKKFHEILDKEEEFRKQNNENTDLEKEIKILQECFNNFVKWLKNNYDRN